MYLTPWAAVALFLLAAVGSLSILASVGVWIFTARLPEASPDPEPVPASEVVARFTGNVHVVPGDSDHAIDVACFCGRCRRPAGWTA